MEQQEEEEENVHLYLLEAMFQSMDEVGMRSSLISRKAKSNDKGPVETFHLFFIEM